jgi:uncharacterized protein (DUF111 family)
MLDVLQMPAFGKKGRMVFHLQVLCRSDAIDDVIRLCLLQTTTLGVRWTVSQRATLKRETIATGDNADSVSVKIASRPDGEVSAKCEIEDIRDSGNHGKRQARRREAEERALEERSSKK